MVGLVTSAAMAVSVIVVAPGSGSGQMPQKQYFETPVQANFAQAVDQWADRAGLPTPQIDPRVATVSVGQLKVAGANICDAVRELVSALKHADQRPQLNDCGASSDGRIVVGVANR